MDLLTLTAVLAAALSHASWNALLKSTDPIRSSVGLGLSWTVLGVPLLWLVPFPGREVLPLLGATVALHLVYFALLARAYRASDFGVVYPIARGLPPVMVLVISVALGEDELTSGGVFGVLLVSAGIASLARGIASANRSGAWLAVLTAVLIAAYTVIDGIGARRASTPGAFLLWLAVGQGSLYTLGAVISKGRTVLPRRRGELARALATGVLAAFGYFVVLWAMTRAPLAVVSAVRETGVLFAALISVVILREPLGTRRIASAVLITAGIVWLQLAF